MSGHSKSEDLNLAKTLLDVIPELVRRIHADVPVDGEALLTEPGLREVAELRATPGQLSLLRILIERDRCMMQEVAEQLGVAPSTATAMVKRLLAQGYIERSRDEVDWRTVRVRITERGRQVYTVFDQARLRALQQRLDLLSEEEQGQIERALPALHHLTQVEESKMSS